MCLDEYLRVYLSTTCVCVSGVGDENKMSDPWNWRYYRWLWAAGCGWWQWSPRPQQEQQVIVTGKRLSSSGVSFCEVREKTSDWVIHIDLLTLWRPVRCLAVLCMACWRHPKFFVTEKSILFILKMEFWSPCCIAGTVLTNHRSSSPVSFLF